MKNTTLLAALVAASLLSAAPAALADSTDDIINALIAKGVLTEEEGALLMKGRSGEKEAAEAKKKTAVTGKFKDGIVFETGDGKHTLALTGRMHLDYRSVNADNEPDNAGVGAAAGNDDATATLADQFEIRRARVGVKGKLYEHFDYEVVGNLVGSNTNIIDVAYLNAGMFKPVQLRIGQFKQPFTLEELTSSNNIDFMERSYVNQITPAKKPGIMVHGVPVAGVTYAASYYQQNNFGETDSDTDGKGFAGRLTANVAEMASWKDTVLHVGLSGLNSEYGIVPTTSGQTSSAASTTTRGTIFSFRTEGRGLNPIYRAQIAGDALSTATYGGRSNTSAQVDNKAVGLELSGAWGPFKLQGEYVRSDFEAEHANSGNRVEAEVRAFYAEALWLITGEKYADFYKNGVWGGIKPNTPFDLETGKGKGALEIGLRYDEFEVGDTLLSGSTNSRFQGSLDAFTSGTNSNNTAGNNGGKGGAKTYTAGIKWQLNPNVRVMLNYSHTKFDNAFLPIDVSYVTNAMEDEKLVMLRTQFGF